MAFVYAGINVWKERGAEGTVWHLKSPVRRQRNCSNTVKTRIYMYEPSDLRWLPRVFTNNPSYQAYVTEGNLVTLSLRYCSRDSPLRLPI